MNQSSTLDIEKYRNPNETEKEWRLKSQFIEKHCHKFDEDRLLCLAQCFVNIETMGCRYPNELMRQIKELTADLKVQETTSTEVSQSNETQQKLKRLLSAQSPGNNKSKHLKSN